MVGACGNGTRGNLCTHTNIYIYIHRHASTCSVDSRVDGRTKQAGIGEEMKLRAGYCLRQKDDSITDTCIGQQQTHTAATLRRLRLPNIINIHTDSLTGSFIKKRKYKRKHTITNAKIKEIYLK